MKIFPTTLRPGSRGPAVLLLQIMLLPDSFDGEQVVLSGVFDKATERAVVSLQATLGVKRTGELDEATHEAIKRQWGPDLRILDTDDFTNPTSFDEGVGQGQELLFFDLAGGQTLGIKPEVQALAETPD